MTHPRALTEQQAIDAESWYTDYERVGTIGQKCRQLGISPHTLYDAIRRVRGGDTRVVRAKMTAHDLDVLAATLMQDQSPTNVNVPSESTQTVEEQLDTLKVG